MKPSPYDQISTDDVFHPCGTLSVVSACPECGWPIYAKPAVHPDEEIIVRPSCKCSSYLNRYDPE